MSPRLDTVFTWVTDLEQSIEWYSALGLAPGPRHGVWQEIALEGGTKFALHEGVRPPGGSTTVPSFAVSDLNAEIERLAGLGIEPVDAITDTGAARFITFTDPDGNQVQLLER